MIGEYWVFFQLTLHGYYGCREPVFPSVVLLHILVRAVEDCPGGKQSKCLESGAEFLADACQRLKM